jgi:hypothetical protein
MRFLDWNPPKDKEKPRVDKTGAEILETLRAEELAEYFSVYHYQVEKNIRLEGFPRDHEVIRLDKSEPHPDVGELSRLSARDFYSSILRDAEGGEPRIVFSHSPDPFVTKGEGAVVIGAHPSDEDCLIVRPTDPKGLKSQEGWCHPENIGTSQLATRKKETLALSMHRRHMKRWVSATGGRATSSAMRETLFDNILESEGVFCVQGPPGTGKTHLACEVAGRLIQRDESARILVCAKEHQALGILRAMLLDRFGERIGSHALLSHPFTDFATRREGSSTEWAQKTVQTDFDGAPSQWRKLVSSWKGQAPPILARVYGETAQVVFATTTSSGLMNKRRFAASSEPFDLVIVEEAGKCYPSELFPALAQARRALLIGDQNQLPPFQIEEAKNAVDHLQQRSTNSGTPNGTEPSSGDSVQPGLDWSRVKKWLQPFAFLQESCSRFTLTDQYRMIPVISDMIAKTFYSTSFVNKRSKENSRPLFHHPLFKDSPLVWIDVPFSGMSPKAREDVTRSRSNRMELQIVSKLVRELECQGSPIPTIAILSPYNAQVDRLAGNNGLKAVLPSESPNIPGLAVRNSVHSVDSFQGNEADLVVLSLVRNNSFGGPHNAWGFVLNPERLNVMLSRARLQLIVVGCSTLIVLHSAHESMKPLVDVLDYFRRFGRVISCRELGLVFP